MHGRIYSSAICIAGMLVMLCIALSNCATSNIQDNQTQYNRIYAGLPINEQLMKAIQRSDLAHIKETIVRGANINHKDFWGQTPLIRAASDGKVIIIALLLDNAAVIDATDNNGSTALIWATTFSQFEAANYLIERGSEINAANSLGQTALMLASREGSLEVVILLVESGADLEMRDKQSRTALSYAQEAGNSTIEQYLLYQKRKLLQWQHQTI